MDLRSLLFVSSLLSLGLAAGSNDYVNEEYRNGEVVGSPSLYPYHVDDVTYPERRERKRERLEKRKQRRKERKERRRKIRPNGGWYDNEEDTMATGIRLPMSQVVPDMEWIAQNLSSLWSFMRMVQKDIRQIKRHHRLGDLLPSPTGGSINSPERSQTSCPQGVNMKTCLDDRGRTCSGKGSCICDTCSCESPHYGSLCQCNDHTCNHYNGILCGGAEHGQCRCGFCVCREGYTGDACDCAIETGSCATPGNQRLLCSGKGLCQCGHCACQDGFHGKWCEESIYAAGLCERLKPCVLCQALGKTLPQCEGCTNKLQKVEELKPDEKTCVMIHLGCLLKYGYTLPSNVSDIITVSVIKDVGCLNN